MSHALQRFKRNCMRTTSGTAISVSQKDTRSTLGNHKSNAIQSRRMCPPSQTRTSTQKFHHGQSLGYARSTSPTSPTVTIISSSRLAGNPICVLDQAIATPAATNPMGIPHPLLVKCIAQRKTALTRRSRPLRALAVHIRILCSDKRSPGLLSKTFLLNTRSRKRGISLQSAYGRR
jgi:hypothetical protein